MSRESWFKIVMPAFPVGFTIFGVWIYWRENPLALLPSPIAFAGVVILFYLFTHLYVPSRRYPLIMIMLATILWLVASITAHNLGKFLSSREYSGAASIMTRTDFWYAYICAGIAFAAALKNFLRYEPLIVARVQEDRRELNDEGE
jgi:hypothetical protein